MLSTVNREREKRGCSVWGWLVRGNRLCYASSSSLTRGQKHVPTPDNSTRPHTYAQAGLWCVCTCERILSAGPSFSPMVLSRCSSVSSGNVSPSMACSRNTWQRHRCFSHSPGTHAYTFIHTTYKTVARCQNATSPLWKEEKLMIIIQHFDDREAEIFD